MKAFVVKSCLLIELSVTKLTVVKWLFPEKLFVITLAVVIGSLVVMGASVVMVIASTRLSVRLTSLIQRLDDVVSRRILLYSWQSPQECWQFPHADASFMWQFPHVDTFLICQRALWKIVAPEGKKWEKNNLNATCGKEMEKNTI